MAQNWSDTSVAMDINVKFLCCYGHESSNFLSLGTRVNNSSVDIDEKTQFILIGEPIILGLWSYSYLRRWQKNGRERNNDIGLLAYIFEILL